MTCKTQQYMTNQEPGFEDTTTQKEFSAYKMGCHFKPLNHIDPITSFNKRGLITSTSEDWYTH